MLTFRTGQDVDPLRLVPKLRTGRTEVSRPIKRVHKTEGPLFVGFCDQDRDGTVSSH